MKRALQVFGYLKHHTKGKLSFDPTLNNYSRFEFKDENWTECFLDVEEYIYTEQTQDQIV